MYYIITNTMKERLPTGLHDIAHNGRRIYWKLAKPTRYGVKCIVHHPSSDSILAVRNTHGEQDWTLPGGRYNPKREAAGAAASREVMEELGLIVGVGMRKLYTEETQLEYKHDTITVFAAPVSRQDNLRLSNGIQEAVWVPRLGIEDAPELKSAPLSRFVIKAAELLSL